MKIDYQQGSKIGKGCKDIVFTFDSVRESLCKISNPAKKVINPEKLLKAESGATHVSIRDLIGLTFEGKIIPYQYNRGDGKIYQEQVNQIENEMTFSALGELQFGLIKIDDKSILKIANAHNRLPAIVNSYIHGNFTKKDLDYLLSVRVVKESQFLDVYKKSNKAVPHTTAGDYRNFDFVFGKIIRDRILGKLSPEEKKFYDKKSNYSVLAYIICAKHYCNRHSYKVRSYADVYSLRTETKKMSTNEYGKSRLSISDKDIDCIVHALKFFYIYVQKVKEHGHRARVKITSIISNKGWMGCVVTDQSFLSEDKHQFYNNPKILANKVWKHYAKVNELIPYISRSSIDSMDVWIEKISRQLNKQ